MVVLGGMVLGGCWLKACVLEMWFSGGWRYESGTSAEGREPQLAPMQGMRPRDAKLLRYPLATLKPWDINTQIVIFRDMAVDIFDKLSRVR